MATESNIIFPAGSLDPSRVAYLIAGYVRSTLTEDEHNELDDWVAESDENMQLFGELTDERTIATNMAKLSAMNPTLAYSQLTSRVKSNSGKSTLLAVAASFTLIITAYFVYHYFDEKPDTGAVLLAAANDIAPGGSHATLTIAGIITDLNEVQKGTIFATDSSKVEISDDGLHYTPGAFHLPGHLHTLATPNGGQYSVLLADGTRVWLNAASSLTYPAVFDSDKRLVELTGEGFFEVAAITDEKSKKPFVVQVGGLEIKVTGTAFNINAYSNEPYISTTVSEGSVVVSDANGSVAASANQQVNYTGSTMQLNDVAAKEAIAWRNNLFEFKNKDIYAIMRQVERWYNVKVVYNGLVDGAFNASVDRNVPVSKLLRYLQLTNRVKFDIKQDTIFVNAIE